MINQRTLVILKPDTVARGIMGDIISRFERIGLKIVAMKMISATKEQLQEHYQKDDEWLIKKGKMIIENKGYPADYDPKKAGQEIVDGLMSDMMLYPVVAMIIEGHNAVKVVKKIVGPTDIEEAAPGTIRGDYSHDTYGLANVSDRPIITIVHCTGEPEEAENELNIWFTPEEIQDYDRVETQLHYRKK